MLISDFINGSFEFAGSFFLFINCLRTMKDKKVKGVSIISTSFFASWGIWNLYYYPSLGQWWSFFGGVSIVVMNIFWVCLMIKYRKN